jgi:hypothetical protein
VDAALVLVQGSFLAASKLLDLEPQKFRNLVNWNSYLKAKWGKKRGAQKRSGFPIKPYKKPAPAPPLIPTAPGRIMEGAKTFIVNHLSNEELVELESWIGQLKRCREFDKNRRQKSGQSIEESEKRAA